jgi:hypothetical protein
MARRHDSERSGYSSLITRRGLLKTVGAGAVASVGGIASSAGRAAAAPSVVDLGKQGLKDGDDVSPYIDQYWNDGVEVRIPAGSYRYDGSGLHGKRGDCALIGSEDGVEFHRPDDDRRVAPTIQCTYGTLRVENITVRGAKPASANTEGSRWRFDALDPNSRCEVVNVNHPDGTEGCSDGVGFLTYDDHRGTVLYKNCFVRNMGNSSFYVNLGYHPGESNPVVIDNCTIVNPNGAIRGGHNDSVIRNTTFVWRKQPNPWVNCATNARGIRNDHGGHDMLIENCHFYFGGDIGTAGRAIDPASQGADTSGVVRGVYVHTEGNYGGIADRSGWSYENLNVSGPGSASAPVSTGTTPPDLRNENAVWMPESRTVVPRAGGGNPPTSTPESDAAGSSGGDHAGSSTGGSGTISTRTRKR